MRRESDEGANTDVTILLTNHPLL